MWKRILASAAIVAAGTGAAAAGGGLAGRYKGYNLLLISLTGTGTSHMGERGIRR